MAIELGDPDLNIQLGDPTLDIILGQPDVVVPSTPSEIASAARNWSGVSSGKQIQIQAYIIAYAAGLGDNPNTLAQLAKCLMCANYRQLLEFKAYLLAVLAGLPTDAQALATASECYECIPQGMLIDAETYLWSLYGSGPGITDVNELLAAANGLQGLSPLVALAIQVYALAILAGVSADKNDLAAASKCMRCFGDALLQTIILYSAAVYIGTGTSDSYNFGNPDEDWVFGDPDEDFAFGVP